MRRQQQRVRATRHFELRGVNHHCAPATLSLQCFTRPIKRRNRIHSRSHRFTRLNVICSVCLTPLQLAAHVVVVAIGVAPAIDPGLFKEGQAPNFAEDGGICVNACMQSSVACVLAAGDCCSVRQAHSLHWFQMRLWEQAAVMGALQLQAVTRCRSLINSCRCCRCPLYADARPRTSGRH